MKIYHAPGTRSIRPIWLCFELDLDVEIETIAFTEEYLSSPEWLAISPAGKLPLFVDEEFDGFKLFESGAMMDYILDRYGQGELRPELCSNDWAIHQQWSWFAESTLARPLGINRMLNADKFDAPLHQVAREKIESCIGVIESELDSKAYIVNDDFYAADIMLGYSLVLTQRFGILDARYPNTAAYVERLLARPACQRAIAV